MKVLLTQDVKGKGKAGDIINANDGYARNFLIPRGLAVAADANNIHAANLKKQADVHRREVARQNARALADEMKGLTVKVYAKAGSGKLFGSIGAAEIAEHLGRHQGGDHADDRQELHKREARLSRIPAAALAPLVCIVDHHRSRVETPVHREDDRLS